MTDLDTLMSMDPLELSAQDIDEIIAYQRKARSAYDTSGKKPKREVEPGKVITLETLGFKPKGGPGIRRV